MNLLEETKEILDDFLHIICTQCNYQDEVKYSLTYKQMKILLDYITNLQEENKELKKKRTKILTREKLQLEGYHKIVSAKQKYKHKNKSKGR